MQHNMQSFEKSGSVIKKDPQGYTCGSFEFLNYRYETNIKSNIKSKTTRLHHR